MHKKFLRTSTITAVLSLVVLFANLDANAMDELVDKNVTIRSSQHDYYLCAKDDGNVMCVARPGYVNRRDQWVITKTAPETYRVKNVFNNEFLSGEQNSGRVLMARLDSQGTNNNWKITKALGSTWGLQSKGIGSHAGSLLETTTNSQQSGATPVYQIHPASKSDSTQRWFVSLAE